MSGDIAELANALGQVASLQEEVERTRNQRDATQVELDGADKVIANLREEVEQLRKDKEAYRDALDKLRDAAVISLQLERNKSVWSDFIIEVIDAALKGDKQ